MFDTLDQKIIRLVNIKGSEAAPLVTIENGVKKVVANHVLILDGANPQTFLSAKTQNNIVGSISQLELIDLLKSILVLYFFADYRRIKENINFRKLYNYAKRQVNYFDGNNVVPMFCDTFPCMRCGLLLPENNITIDHQKPQIGGELLAVLKSFRAFGLTQEGPKGSKGKAYHATHNYDELFKVIMGDSLIPIGPHSPIQGGGDKAKRQSLNERGTLVYSALLHSGDESDLHKICMNSLINLKPLCLRCNTSKGNTILG